MGTVVLVISWRRGGTLLGGMKRTLQFVLSVVGVLQLIIQIGRAAQPGLPLLLYRFYSILLLLQLDGITLHPNCVEAPPFQQEIAEMAMGLSLMAALGLLFFNFRRFCRCYGCGLGEKGADRLLARGSAAKSLADDSDCGSGAALGHKRLRLSGTSDAPGAADTCCVRWGRGVDRVKPLLRRIIFTLLTLLYATVANAVLRMLPCENQSLRVADYLQLSMDGTTLRSQLGIGLSAVASACLDANCERRNPWYDRTVSVSVLSYNPAFVCYESTHFVVAVLAWTCLAVYTLAYPLGSFLLLRRRLTQIMVRGPLRRHYEMALTKDYMRRQAWAKAGGSACTRGWRRLCVRVCCLGSRFTPPGAAPAPRGILACCTAFGSAVTPLGGDEVAASSSTAAATEAFAQLATRITAGAGPPSGGFANETEERRRLPPTTPPLPEDEVESAGPVAAKQRMLAQRTVASLGVGQPSVAKSGALPGGAGLGASLNYARRKSGLVVSRSPGVGAALAGVAGPVAGGGGLRTPPSPKRKLLTSSALDSSVAASGNPMHGAMRQTPAVAGKANGSLAAGLATTAASERITSELGAATVVTANSLMDGNPSILRNASLAHFTAADYRASRYWMRQEDMALLFALGLLAAFWPRTTDPLWCAGLLAFTAVAVCVEASVIIAQKPFKPESQWMLFVRLATVLLAFVSALLNYANAINPLPVATGLAADDSSTSTSGSSSTERPLIVTALSYLAFACSMLLAVVLILSFLLSLWQGARKEEVDTQLGAAAERAEANRLSMLRDAITRVATPLQPVATNSEEVVRQRHRRRTSAAGDAECSDGRVAFGTLSTRSGRMEGRTMQRPEPAAPRRRQPQQRAALSRLALSSAEEENPTAPATANPLTELGSRTSPRTVVTRSPRQASHRSLGGFGDSSRRLLATVAASGSSSRTITSSAEGSNKSLTVGLSSRHLQAAAASLAAPHARALADIGSSRTLSSSRQAVPSTTRVAPAPLMADGCEGRSHEALP
jgi:hypothetical protein